MTLGWLRSRRTIHCSWRTYSGRGVEVAVLVHDQHAQAVAGVEELGGGRVVRAAVGVGAHFLQPAHAEIPERVRHGDADPGVVLVVADALELERLVVEEKALVGVEADRAEAAGGGDFVDAPAIALERRVRT